MRSCDFNSTLDSTKAWLRTRGFIDENMRIKTSLPGFKDQVGKLTVMAKQKFGVDEGDLFTVEKIEVPKLTPTPYYRTDDKRTVYKAVPNERAFNAIDTYKSGKSFMKVDYGLKVAEIISDNIDRIEKLFKSIGNNDTFWNKIQKDFQIPKAQLLLFKDTAGANIQEKLASFLADYSYTVEINTAKGKLKPIIRQENITKEIFDSIDVEPEFDGDPESYSYIKETPEAIYYATFNSEGAEYYTKSIKGEQNNNSSHYSNLTF